MDENTYVVAYNAGRRTFYLNLDEARVTWAMHVEQPREEPWRRIATKMTPRRAERLALSFAGGDVRVLHLV
jgi:hypothetical protein